MPTKNVQRADAGAPFALPQTSSVDRAKKNPATVSPPTDAAKKVDFNVALSDHAKSRQAAQKKATDIAMSTSPVREDRVAALKEQIKNGSYRADSGKIADGMLKEAQMEYEAEKGSR